MIEKELSSIAWNVPESTYRQDPFLSQSTLGTYEKLGFNGLDHLFDKKESPSLTFGSCVDAILTGGMEEFNSRFAVIDINLTDGGMDTVKKLLELKLPYDFFSDIPEDIVSNTAKEVGFWQADKWDKVRYKKVLETGNIAEYYEASRQSDRTFIDTKTYEDVMACVETLKTSAATSGYFADNDDMSPVRRYYQLKFKDVLEGVGYRGMMDLLIVDYEDKIVYPFDLKTSSHMEWDFEDSFLQWGYMIQARLYWRLLRNAMDKDDYFKDFKLENFKFIVINRVSRIPLVWEFPLTKSYGTLLDDKGREYRDPFEIGKELQGYLDVKPQVPNNIDMSGTNIINCLKLKES